MSEPTTRDSGLLRTQRQRLERQCRAHMMFHRRGTTIRKCYWRALRERYAPGLPHHIKVWRRIVNAPNWPRVGI